MRSSFKIALQKAFSRTVCDSLEIFRNTTDYTERGSLLWLLDNCRTAFGRRQLRRWIGHPLVRVADLQERLDCVQELLESQDYRLGKLRGLLMGLPDLEKVLSSILVP